MNDGCGIGDKTILLLGTICGVIIVREFGHLKSERVARILSFFEQMSNSLKKFSDSLFRSLLVSDLRESLCSQLLIFGEESEQFVQFAHFW